LEISENPGIGLEEGTPDENWTWWFSPLSGVRSLLTSESQISSDGEYFDKFRNNGLQSFL
jgi:hypothetical protein